MIEIFSHTFENDDFDSCYPHKIMNRRGDKIVSFGVDAETGKRVSLYGLPWKKFIEERCYQINGSWYLMEDAE